MINHSDIQQDAVTAEQSSLQKLQYWLEYEKYTGLLMFGAVWFYALVFRLLYLAAIVFTPYMLWHLYKAKWYKAIITFIFVVLFPFAIVHLITLDNSIIDSILKFIPFFFFYFYTWILSYMIKNYTAERAELKRIEQVKEGIGV